jgi:hypothetical protein
MKQVEVSATFLVAFLNINGEIPLFAFGHRIDEVKKVCFAFH